VKQAVATLILNVVHSIRIMPEKTYFRTSITNLGKRIEVSRYILSHSSQSYFTKYPDTMAHKNRKISSSLDSLWRQDDY
jgi:hypothetical protein